MVQRKIEWISPARFQPHLDACGGDEGLSWSLYEWNARVASEMYEFIHHAEVLLRNAMMRELEQLHPLDYPWQREQPRLLSAANRRRSPKTMVANPDAVVAEVTLEFWSSLLDKSGANEDLWRRSLRHAFPGSPGTRESVHRAVEDLRRLRNRCAHQDSLLNHDLLIELKKLLTLIEWIDPAARAWVETMMKRVIETVAGRPVPPSRDVVVIGASADLALAMYAAVAAYVCPADRSFAPVSRLGFYADKKIEPYFPLIEHTVVPARWNSAEATRLQQSSSSVDVRVGKVMAYGLKKGWPAGGSFQVFLLSRKDDPRTVKRNGPVPHLRSGRGSAFVQNKRYLSLSALKAAADTAQLEA